MFYIFQIHTVHLDYELKKNIWLGLFLKFGKSLEERVKSQTLEKLAIYFGSGYSTVPLKTGREGGDTGPEGGTFP